MAETDASDRDLVDSCKSKRSALGCRAGRTADSSNNGTHISETQQVPPREEYAQAAKLSPSVTWFWTAFAACHPYQR